MKDVFKSKVMIGFLVFIMGFFYINAADIKKMDESKNRTSNQNYVAVNF